MPEKLTVQSETSLLPVTYPSDSDVQIEENQTVKKDQIIATKAAPPIQYNLAEKLQTSGKKIQNILAKKVGDYVESGEILIETKSWFKSKKVISQTSGTITHWENGILSLQSETPPEEILSPVDGKIIKIEPTRILIEIPVETISVTWAWGSRVGDKLTVIGSPKAAPELETVKGNYQNRIVVAGGQITKALWHKLSTLGATGIICHQKIPDMEQWFAEEEQLDHQHLPPSIVAFELDDGQGFASSVWEWFNKNVGNITIIDPEKKTVSICRN